MCTLLVAHRTWSGLPFLVAANRDEQLDRSSSPPRLWADRPVPLIAPVDEVGRGTWLGLNAHGVFVGITNRFGTQPPRRDRRSRGLLVLDALEEADARSAARRAAAHDASVHNRFNLLAVDRRGVYLVVNDGEHIRRIQLATGLHVLTERSRVEVTEPNPREKLIASRMKEHLESGVPTERDLAGLLSIHAQDPFDGTCVHAGTFDYGTRSSSLIWRYKDSIRFLHAEGPPCQTPYRDYSARAESVLALL
jgi:uncharacterized protein with NRDE domain